MSEDKKEEVVEEVEEKQDEKIVPTYKFVVEEGDEELPPVKRKIAKTMEVTETFNYYDALKYKMQMEKAIGDKEKEIGTLKTMVEKYEEELGMIEEQFDINEMERTYQVELHEKLKLEEDCECTDECEESDVCCEKEVK